VRYTRARTRDPIPCQFFDRFLVFIRNPFPKDMAWQRPPQPGRELLPLPGLQFLAGLKLRLLSRQVSRAQANKQWVEIERMANALARMEQVSRARVVSGGAGGKSTINA
jgi:hypothetical protein